MMKTLRVLLLGVLLVAAPQAFSAWGASGSVQILASGGTSITPVPPGGIASSDYACIFLTADLATDPVTAWPSGFTDLGIAHATPAQAGNTTLTVACKPAGTALPGSYTVTTSTTGRTMAVIITWTGRAGTAATVSLTNSAGSGGGAGPRNCTVTGLTANTGDDLIFVCAASANANTATYTAPASYTETIDQANGNDSMTVAYRDNVSSGATGNVIGSSSGGSGVDLMGILIALPVSGGGGGGTVINPITGGGGTAARPVTFNLLPAANDDQFKLRAVR